MLLTLTCSLKVNLVLCVDEHSFFIFHFACLVVSSVPKFVASPKFYNQHRAHARMEKSEKANSIVKSEAEWLNLTMQLNRMLFMLGCMMLECVRVEVRR